MLKKPSPWVLTALVAMVGLGAHAQQLPDGRGPGWCGTSAVQERYFAQHPGARQADQRLYQLLQAQAERQLRSPDALPEVIVPVVVHVVHAGGAENISDGQIASAVEELNLDFFKLNADTIHTAPSFRPIAAALGFQFRLAKKDPRGNCSNGITRHYAPALVRDNLSGAVQAMSYWEPTRYLNIWVVGSIGAGATTGTVLGYAYLPQTNMPPVDGFVVRHDYFGNHGTSNPTRSRMRTATHEIGHYFGLRHTWGNGNNPGIANNCGGTDFVADTPPTNGTFACNLAYAPCPDTATGQLMLANVQNYMDYAPCPTMFTQGQKALMHRILSTIRTNLTADTNLSQTGTNDGYVAPGCAPTAAFGPVPGTSTAVCVQDPVTLRDYSFNFSSTDGPLTHAWSFPGGTPASATGALVSVAYPAAGFYTVMETVTNRIGTGTVTQANIIKVEGPTGGETAPFAESFERENFPNIHAAPSLRNYEVTSTSSAGLSSPAFVWARETGLPAADGLAYLVVNNRLHPTNTTATLITPNLNLASVPTPAVLSFSRAFALRFATSNEQLRLSFSNDCGASWTTPFVLNATALSTQGPTALNGYMPTTTVEWQTLSLPIPAQYQASSLLKVRLQFVNGDAPGNNFYLDNLRISSPLPTAVGSLINTVISLYPVPLTSETAVHLTLAATTRVQLSLTDLLSRTVFTLPALTYGPGPRALPLAAGRQGLRPGVYIVRISLDGEVFTRRLAVN